MQNLENIYIILKFREYIYNFGFDIFKTVNKERKTVYIISKS